LQNSFGPFTQGFTLGCHIAAFQVCAETNYRYQIVLRTRQMSALSKHVPHLTETLELPEGVSLSVDIDPVNLS
jgi:primosomal protein N'